MLPHAPLRRVFIVTFSGALLVGLLTYVEYGVFVRGALVGGAIGAILTSLEIFVLRRNAGAFFRRLPFMPYLRSARFALCGRRRAGQRRHELASHARRSGHHYEPRRHRLHGRYLHLHHLAVWYQRSARPGCALRLCRRALLPPPPRGARFALHRHALVDRDRREPRRGALPSVSQSLRYRPVAVHFGRRRRNPQICRR